MRLRLCVGYVLCTKRREALLRHCEERRERKIHRLSSAETPTLSRGSSHDVQISPWMSLHSWPRWLQISFVITSRFIYMFLSLYPVTVDEKLCVSLPQGYRLDVSKRTYWPKTQILTEISTRTQLNISQVPTVQSEFRSFKLHQASKCTHRVMEQRTA